jgi:hypothetical protein
MRRYLLIALPFVVSLVMATSEARAVVVDPSASGTTVSYPTDQSNYVGVALVPGTRGNLATAGVPTVSSSAPCSDPWLSSDLGGPLLPPNGLCWNGGGATPSNAVIHGNETFAITWDANHPNQPRNYWATTRGYVEQFLKDVADGTGTLTSPYAVTTQYADQSGRAANRSKYGGGCIDYGYPGESACQFGNTIGTGPGNNYPTSGCSITGTSYTSTNDVCLTDSQLQAELATMVTNMSLVGRTQPGYTPLLVLLTPPGVETCLDGHGKLCSANSGAGARFCSYHSHIEVGGTNFAYVVQPWIVHTGCDEPKLPALPANPTAQQLAIDAGVRLVNPLSQGQIAAIVNPWLNGWFANDGSEINDNDGCAPAGVPADNAVVGNSSQNPYLLQAEFSNGGVIEIDPNGPVCATAVALSPTFVVPSPIDQGDVVAFDGSTTVSSLVIPNAEYKWDFGDGTTSVGASVVHSYAKGGTYTVTLNVADRGGNVSSVSQTISVLGPNGQPVSSTITNPGLRVRLLLAPQSLRTVLRAGVAVWVSSNEPADGIVTLSISRNAARRAHISPGRGATVMIGRGTVSSINTGTVSLHLHLSRAMAAKLKHLSHVTLTVRLALVAASGDRLAIDAAGHY